MTVEGGRENEDREKKIMWRIVGIPLATASGLC